MADIFLHLNGEQVGPYQPAQLRQMLSEGKITSETPAWHQGLNAWSTAWVVLASFPVEGSVPGMPPPPPPAPAKKGMSGLVIALIVGAGLFIGLFVLSCLAGIALGPITNGIKKAKENMSMQQARSIDLLMFMYAADHQGSYPDGGTSTEVFQKLIDEKYAADPAIFYFAMEGKTRPTSNHLTAENVCFDVTSGIKSDSSDFVPVVFSTGYTVTYIPGVSPVRDPDVKLPFPGMAVAYKNNSARFITALPDGTFLHLIPPEFNSGDKTYKQLKP